ncbi:MAG TPA: serine hydrolase domain-containing protein [Candidatus Limnocylindrales bacterium]|nr:serine hydrolase domain-containing protein [Candidatus Limnocylindrales bacterium]
MRPLDRLLAAPPIPGTALVVSRGRVRATGDRSARYPIYSLTKPVIAAAILRLVAEGRLSLDDPAPDDWPGTVRQLLDHTSGARDYGALPAYHEAVRTRPLRPWSDRELLRRAAAAGPTFEPGGGWAYSNTGYLLLRRLLDRHGGLASHLPALGLPGMTVALRPEDLDEVAPAPSRLIGDGVDDIRGAYDPRWVGHRTLVGTADDLLAFWRTLPPAMLDPATFIPIGHPATGFVRPAYGLGLMTDPASPLGLVVGHGGGGPGYAHGVFAAPAAGALAIVLTRDERYDAQGLALRLLEAAIRDGS